MALAQRAPTAPMPVLPHAPVLRFGSGPTLLSPGANMPGLSRVLFVGGPCLPRPPHTQPTARRLLSLLPDTRHNVIMRAAPASPPPGWPRCRCSFRHGRASGCSGLPLGFFSALCSTDHCSAVPRPGHTQRTVHSHGRERPGEKLCASFVATLTPPAAMALPRAGLPATRTRTPTPHPHTTHRGGRPLGPAPLSGAFPVGGGGWWCGSAPLLRAGHRRTLLWVFFPHCNRLLGGWAAARLLLETSPGVARCISKH